MKKSIDVAKHTITFTFDGLAPVVFHADQAHDDNIEYAMLQGFSGRIGDNAAISRKGPDGTVITVTETMRRDAVLELVTHYESGADKWEISGRTRTAAQNPTILAIAAKRGCTYVEAEAFLAAQFLNEME